MMRESFQMLGTSFAAMDVFIGDGYPRKFPLRVSVKMRRLTASRSHGPIDTTPAAEA
jgi:hypothetical protein